MTRYDQGQLVIYLPIAFDQPFLIERDTYPEKAIIGSSLLLLYELELLNGLLVAKKDDVTNITQQTRYAHQLLYHFAKLSWELQLPLFMSW